MASAAPASDPKVRTLPALERYFEVSLFLLVATGVVAIVSTGKLDPLTTALSWAALIFKGVRIWRNLGPEFPPRLATWLVLGYFLFFPLDIWVLSSNLAAGAPNPPLYAALLAAIHLLLFATFVRLYSARTNRDYAFLSFLAVASMLASAILTVETSFLIALGAFVVLAVSTFVALEIRRAADGAVSPPMPSDSPAAHQLNRALGTTSGLIAVGVLVMGAILFFVIPRVTTGYMSGLNLQPNLMTGFSDNVELGQIGEIKKNTAVVMRIAVEGDPARAQNVHWRGIILTNFDGRRWSTPEQEEQVILPDSEDRYHFASGNLSPADFYRLSYTVLMEPVATDAIFIAPRAEIIAGRFAERTVRAGSLQRPGYLLGDSTGSLFNPAHNNFKIRYQGVSRLPQVRPAALRKSPSAYPDVIRGRYLQLPPLDARIPELAQSITKDATNDYDKAAKLEAYLSTHYAYTLDLSGPKADDPLANFLFVRRSGHCEYFASAMTVMLRSLGIPARYATGFLPGEYNDVGGDYIIRQSDAHTWVEVYFTNYGWITFDPTPPGAAGSSGFLARIALYWDWFQFTWGEWVVNYDFAHQLTLGQNIQRSSRNWGDGARDFYNREKEKTLAEIVALDRRVEASPYFLPSVLAFLLALLLLLRGRFFARYVMARWSLRARHAGNLSASMAALEYTEMLRLLEKQGWKKQTSQTAREFAAAIPSLDLCQPVAELTEIYQSARFGNHPARVEQMSSLLRSIRDRLRSRKPSGARSK